MTCRSEMLTPMVWSCATSRGTVTCPWWYCGSTNRRNSGPKWLLTPAGKGAVTVRPSGVAQRAAIADRPNAQHQVLRHEILIPFEA